MAVWPARSSLGQIVTCRATAMAARCCQCSGVASETTIRAGRRRVRISNPGKVLFPADGITKLDLAAYYAGVAPAMAPHARDRPLNLWRWNAGIDGPRIVQQEIPKG